LATSIQPSLEPSPSAEGRPRKHSTNSCFLSPSRSRAIGYHDERIALPRRPFPGTRPKSGRRQTLT
jgi:hypothetical protein